MEEIIFNTKCKYDKKDCNIQFTSLNDGTDELLIELFQNNVSTEIILDKKQTEEMINILKDKFLISK